MNFLERLLETPARFVWIKRFFYGGLALVALAEIMLPFLFHDQRHHFSFESWPAFGSLYGLLSCVVIVVASKILGKVWLMRRENYYDA